MSRFTGGKWCYDEASAVVYSENDESSVIANIHGAYAKSCFYCTPEGVANARLIAAAPEMYKVITELAYGSCDNCVPVMVSARELLARIDGEEDITNG